MSNKTPITHYYVVDPLFAAGAINIIGKIMSTHRTNGAAMRAAHKLTSERVKRSNRTSHYEFIVVSIKRHIRRDALLYKYDIL